MFVCGLPMAVRTAGPIRPNLAIGTGTHVDPGSVLVKVKSRSFIYACGIIEFMTATPAGIRLAAAVAAATW